VKVVISQGKIV